MKKNLASWRPMNKPRYYLFAAQAQTQTRTSKQCSVRHNRYDNRIRSQKEPCWPVVCWHSIGSSEMPALSVSQISRFSLFDKVNFGQDQCQYLQTCVSIKRCAYSAETNKELSLVHFEKKSRIFRCFRKRKSSKLAGFSLIQRKSHSFLYRKYFKAVQLRYNLFVINSTSIYIIYNCSTRTVFFIYSQNTAVIFENAITKISQVMPD